MSPLETFFACGFISTFAVALISTWLRYLPTIISLYRIFANDLEQLNPQRNILTNFKAYDVERRQTQF